MKVDPRFLTGEGPEIFTGNELLLKGALEADGGVHLLGGYPGSPVAGFFDSMAFIKDLLNEKGIRAVINNNEALAAAMLNGSQVAGCRAIICMKSVGVHVAADALALGSLAGAHPNGGAVIIYGDDPWSDSTQAPSDSRFISRHLFIPVIEPSDGQEVKDFIDLSLKVSRRAELYCGFIAPTNLADGGGTVICRPNQYPRANTLRPFEIDTAAINLDKFVLLPPRTWWQEAKYAARFERAMAVSRELKLNRIDYPADRCKPIGFATSGLAYGYLVQTLLELGLLGEFPVLKFGMSYPVDPAMVRELASQCQRIVVVEERRSFIEEQINEVVLKDRQTGGPAGDVEVWGKQFPGGIKGFPDIRGLHPSIITKRLVPLLKHLDGGKSSFIMPAGAQVLDRELAAANSTAQAEMPALLARTPTFCAGCPHRETASLCLEVKDHFADADYMRRVHKRKPVDLLFHGDTGCYTMLMFPPNERLMHNYSGMGLGGGTGSGMAPFITNKQAVFMGDSTFFHSGQIAISQAIKLGQDITFIILDNRTTGMTGHQPTPGSEFDILGNLTSTQDIEEVVQGFGAGRNLSLVRIDPENRKEYRQLLERTLLADGVKVIISDKECAITRTRRKRRADRSVRKQLGFLPKEEFLHINHEACRFCLACIERTGCPGLTHVDTDYGPKMDTDFSWCVGEGNCERIGACSAFEYVTVKRSRPPRSRIPELNLDDLPEPQKRPVGDVWRCFLAGVGTQGIGTATQIIVRAGHKEGYQVSFLDKKGLAIRGGGVTSQIAYNIAHQPITPVIPYGKADLLIGMDALEAARAIDPNGRSRVASAGHTAAVVNTDKFFTIQGLMGREDYDVADLEKVIHRHTRSADYLARNISRICEKYLGGKIYANIMMLGFAFQKGLIPVSMHSMAWAIKDTIRADFRKNLLAFNMGRKLVLDADLFQGAPTRVDWRDVLDDKSRWILRRYRRGQRLADAFRDLAAQAVGVLADVDDQLKRDVVVRLYDCLRWGGLEYAGRYAAGVLATYSKDSAQQNHAATRAVVGNLAAAMLIKDGVFLAELGTSPEKIARDRDRYSVNPSNGDHMHYTHRFHWTWRLFGRDRQFDASLPSWALKLLRQMRLLRKFATRWHRADREHLARYEKLITEFAWTTPQEYQRRLVSLSNPRCLDCVNPVCRQVGCPLGNLIPQWVNAAAEGRWRDAWDALEQTHNFPEVTCLLCPAPCQDACKQTWNLGAVQIKDSERQIVAHAMEQGWIHPQPATRKTGRKVAVVGSGPAGLAAAQQLARAGHEVAVFEKDDSPGGLLRNGIPDFRFERSLVDRRVRQLQAEGVTFETGVEIGKDVAADELRRRFDAVLLAAGAASPRDLDVPGRRDGGVVFALDFLRTPADLKGKAVVVIGGGDTGNDCAEAAILQGARQVHQLEILPERDRKTDPTHPRGDGVQRRWCVATKAFLGGPGKLSEVACSQVHWVSSSTGPRMIDVPGSEFRLSADIAVLALGYDAKIDPDLAGQLGLAIDPRGWVQTSDHATSMPGVFVAGDLGGQSFIASAIASGRTAAKRVEDYLAAIPVKA